MKNVKKTLLGLVATGVALIPGIASAADLSVAEPVTVQGQPASDQPMIVDLASGSYALGEPIEFTIVDDHTDGAPMLFRVDVDGEAGTDSYSATGPGDFTFTLDGALVGEHVKLIVLDLNRSVHCAAMQNCSAPPELGTALVSATPACADPADDPAVAQLAYTGDIADGNLESKFICDVEVANADLTGSALSRSTWQSCDLPNANLANAVATDLSFTGGSLADGTLRSAHLERASINGTDMLGADLIKASLIGAEFTDVRLNQADLMQANITDATFDRVELIDAKLGNLLAANTVFEQCNIGGADFTGGGTSTLIGATFSNSNLQDANLSGALATDATFSGTNAGRANLAGANLIGITFWSSNLANANLTGAVATNATFAGGSSLEGADFTGANLYGASFNNVSLAGAKLNNAFLWNVDFTGANLTGADFTGANMYNVTCPDGTSGQSDCDAWL